MTTTIVTTAAAVAAAAVQPHTATATADIAHRAFVQYALSSNISGMHLAVLSMAVITAATCNIQHAW